jgi:hypothetical protein
MCLVPILTALLFSRNSLAESTTKTQRCIESCQTALSYIIFAGSTATDYYVDQCTTKLKVTSLYACAHAYCTDEEIHDGVEWANQICKEYGHTTLPPYEDEAPQFTDAWIKNQTVVDYAAALLGVVQNTTVMISRDFYDQSLKTTVGSRLASSLEV